MTLAGVPPVILTIEDEAVIRRSCRRFLEDNGYRVLEAADGRTGIELCRRSQPDLVLVDLRMPETDGLGVLTWLKQNFPDTPAIVVSGTGDIRDAVEALHLGAWDYVIKPIEDMDVLKHAVEKAIERATLIVKDREHQQRLEGLIRKRTEQLEAQNAELERFAYTVSHDLKTPLITIKGFAGMLRKDAARMDVAAMEDDLDRICNAADRMHRLLDELLELSRIGRLVNPPEHVPLAELARDAIDVVRPQIEQKQIDVQIGSNLPILFGDRLRLLQVVQNLVDNAVKYMNDRSGPRIEIGNRQSGDGAICYVRDNGIGIDPKFHTRVFDLFEQLDPRMTGTGVGLALVKRIIEVHGGRVWIESQGEGHGSAFCFTVPDRRDNASHESSEARD